MPNEIADFDTLYKKYESHIRRLGEAGKVFQIGKAVSTGAPTDKARAFDKVNPKTGTRPNRSVLKKMAAKEDRFYAVQYMPEENYVAVLVVRSVDAMKSDYYGINVLFHKGGKVEGSTADGLSEKQWNKYRGEITKIAREALKHDKTLPHAYDGMGDADIKNPGGNHHEYYLGSKTNEGKISFKRFLLAEGFGDSGEYLTRSHKATLLKDFKGWSGGLAPENCTAAQVREYLAHGISSKLPVGPSKKHLEYIRSKT